MHKSLQQLGLLHSADYIYHRPLKGQYSELNLTIFVE